MRCFYRTKRDLADSCIGSWLSMLHRNGWKRMIDVFRPCSFTSLSPKQISLTFGNVVGNHNHSWESNSPVHIRWVKQSPPATAELSSPGNINYHAKRLPLLKLNVECLSTQTWKCFVTLDNQWWLFWADNKIALRSVPQCIKAPLRILQWWTCKWDMVSSGHYCQTALPVYINENKCGSFL